MEPGGVGHAYAELEEDRAMGLGMCGAQVSPMASLSSL